MASQIPAIGRPMVSIVVPAHNERDNLHPLVDALGAELAKTVGSFEVIIVDDGSTDGSAAELERLAALHGFLRYIILSKNFGHQAALRAGLDHSQGHAAVTMDADFQHPPTALGKMIDAWKAGAKVVHMKRRDERKTSAFKRLTARAYYWILGSSNEDGVEPSVGDFRLIDEAVLKVLASLHESEIFYRGLIPRLGFQSVTLEYDLAARRSGTSKYSFSRMVRLAVTGFVNTSTRPLRIASVGALVCLGFCLLYSAYAAFTAVVLGVAQPGWTSVIVLVSLIGGVQLLVLGIIGEYLAQTLREVRGRPPYIVARTNQLEHAGAIKAERAFHQ